LDPVDLADLADRTVLAWVAVCAAPVLLCAAGLPCWRWRWPLVPVLCREAGVVCAVFVVWQIPTRMAAGDLATATARAVRVHSWEESLGLPDEVSWQRAVLPRPWLVQAANWYYAVLHFGAMAAVLVWLFWRHRAAYRRLRTCVVLVTVASLLLQLIAVAPPRLVPRLGFVDTAAVYGQSVYGGGPGSVVADELAAVPSVHVAWAVLVAAAVVLAGRGRARWAAVAHPVLTLVVVVVTGNHFWFDAAAAVLVVAVCAGVQWAAVRHLAPRVRGTGRRSRPAPVVSAGAAAAEPDPGHGPRRTTASPGRR
jgi:hypothetical protein